MKTIGLIGGMSWQSSKFYYEYLNQLIAEALGGSHSAKILMSSVDFAPIEQLSMADNWAEIGALMALEAKKLEAGGADMVILATNTIHLVADAIEKAISIPFLHIARATGDAIAEQKLKKIGLLGTRFTMEQDFYTQLLAKEFGLEVVIPDATSRSYLQQIIYDELVKGIFTEEAKEKSIAIINDLEEKGAEGIILGCTELPILIPDSAVVLPTFNTTLIHAKAAVKFALS
ncbi:MAG: aspartate/glutamate racemase family protein [Allomuricauda sp.]|nr:MAG: aspartate/glutamate racemase family protein [Allomuricauda sp.]